jgi:hypothetical protein
MQPRHSITLRLLNISHSTLISYMFYVFLDRLCGLVVQRSVFDSRYYQIFEQ